MKLRLIIVFFVIAIAAATFLLVQRNASAMILTDCPAVPSCFTARVGDWLCANSSYDKFLIRATENECPPSYPTHIPIQNFEDCQQAVDKVLNSTEPEPCGGGNLCKDCGIDKGGKEETSTSYKKCEVRCCTENKKEKVEQPTVEQ